MSDSEQLKTAALILAAGEGKRFGGPKALAEFGGESFLEIIARNLRGVADSISVVGGAEYERVEMESNRLGLPIIFNAEWIDGQFTSLKAGLRAVSNTAACVIVTLVDHPFVTRETYSTLKNHYLCNSGKIIIPTMSGRRGHPIIIPITMRETILGYPNESNLRNVIQSYSADIVEISVNDNGILRDIDRRQDLEEREWA